MTNGLRKRKRARSYLRVTSVTVIDSEPWSRAAAQSGLRGLEREAPVGHCVTLPAGLAVSW